LAIARGSASFVFLAKNNEIVEKNKKYENYQNFETAAHRLKIRRWVKRGD
jgi:hypothetical protein